MTKKKGYVEMTRGGTEQVGLLVNAEAAAREYANKQEWGVGGKRQSHQKLAAIIFGGIRVRLILVSPSLKRKKCSYVEYERVIRRV